jgi:hypothetical protein
MNHPATFVLPLAAGRVLDVLHSLFTVGEINDASQADIAALVKANIALDRKILSDLAISDPNAFKKVIETARAA